MLKAVRKLRPGCALIVEDGTVRTERYYRTPIQDAEARDDEAGAEDLTQLIDDVVRDQMVADVEVGALLSGGVDSSAIVASMCRSVDPARITTFCATVDPLHGSGDNFGADQGYAQDVATRLGVNNVEVPTDADLVSALPRMVWELDEPTADFAALQTLMLAKEAKRRGIKVLLSGCGGDDLFTGYGRHTAGLMYSLVDRVPGLRRASAALLATLPGKGVAGRRLGRVADLLKLDEPHMLASAMSFSAVPAADCVALLDPAIRAAAAPDGIPTAFAQSLADTDGLDIIGRFLDLELNGFLPDHNLNYTDKMAMRAGVEVRVPLVDKRLVDFAMSIPSHKKIDLRTTKKILRDSQVNRLPRGVLARSKQGFGVPVRAWLRGPARPLLEELTAPSVLHNRGLFDPEAVGTLKRAFLDEKIDAAMTLFPIVAIELWCRTLDEAPVAN